MPTFTDVDEAFLGTLTVDEIFQGDTLVWPPAPAGSWGPDEYIFAASVTPWNNSPQSSPFTFGFRFTPVVDGRITAVRFWSNHPGSNRPVAIWSTAGVKLASGVGPAAEATTGWYTIPLTTPLDVAAGVTYTTAYGWHHTWNQLPYQGDGVVSATPNLTAHTGTYFLGDMDTFPTSSDALHYYADVVFQAGAESPSYDPATQAFLDATGLPESFAPALDGLVAGLKTTGLWAKMKAVYPFIGGTADLHKWNLKDPRDTDDAYRLTYANPGSSTHSTALGFRPNQVHDSTLGYADTHLVPLGSLDINSTHLSLYSLAPLGNHPRCDMGHYNWDGGTGRFHIIAHYTAGEFYYSMASTAVPSAPGGAGSGLYVATRTGPAYQAGYVNGALAGADGSGVYVLPNVPVTIGALNGYAREASDLPFGFASIGDGLAAQDVVDLNRIVTDYQTALGRRATLTGYW